MTFPKKKEQHKCPVCKRGIEHLDWILTVPMGFCWRCGPKVAVKEATIAALKGKTNLRCGECRRTIGVYQYALENGKCGECEPRREDATR